MDTFLNLQFENKNKSWYRFSIRIILVLLFIVSARFASADPEQGKVFLPARFGSDAKSFLPNLQCPEKKEKVAEITFLCQTKVKESGKSYGSYCFGADYMRRGGSLKIEKALNKASFLPAWINGENAEVLMQLAVKFLWKGDACLLYLLPNWGFNSKELSFDYYSPQEIISDLSWYTRTGRLDRGSNIFGVFEPGVLLAMSVVVSTDGVASDERLEKNNSIPKRFAKKSLAAIKSSQFIPGFYNGKPEPMRYYEVLFTK